MAHIAIVGGGITGVTSAHALLKRGHTVTLFDRNRYPAMETSYANGGQLSASNAEVWNSIPTILKGLRWLRQPDAPLRLRLTPNYHKYSWLGEFCAQIPNYKSNTIETARLAILARQYLLSTAAEEKIEFDFEQAGILHIYYNRRSFEKATAANELLKSAGLDRYPVGPAEMRKIEPTLQGDFFGGFYTPSDAMGDIHKFTTQLLSACARRGADIRLSQRVLKIAPSSQGVVLTVAEAEQQGHVRVQADLVLICAGVDSRALAAAVGDRVNIYPVKGYSITVALNDAISREMAPKVSLLDEDAKIVTSRLGADRFRIAGTAEFDGFNRDIRAGRVTPLVRWCERLFPRVSTREVIPWAGLRPMTPSMLPRVGRGRHPRVFYNTGHGHLGWTLSAATAELVADAIESDYQPLGPCQS